MRSTWAKSRKDIWELGRVEESHCLWWSRNREGDCRTEGPRMAATSGRLDVKLITTTMRKGDVTGSLGQQKRLRIETITITCTHLKHICKGADHYKHIMHSDRLVDCILDLTKTASWDMFFLEISPKHQSTLTLKITLHTLQNREVWSIYGGWRVLEVNTCRCHIVELDGFPL